LSGNSIQLNGFVTSLGSNNAFGIPVTLGANGGFSQTVGGTFTVSGAVDTNAKALSLSSTTGTLLVSGQISGSGTVTTSGIGTTALSGSNSYTGVTTVAGGSGSLLSLRNGQALGTNAAGTVVTLSSSTIQLENGIVVSGETLSSNSGISYTI